MKVTGYMIRERLQSLAIVHKLAADSFTPSLTFFTEEEKENDPKEVMKRFADAERDIAVLQTVQARYNLAVQVEVLGEKMPLCQAIKMVGGAGRMEKMWRTAATTISGTSGTDWRGTPERTRSKDLIVSKRAISQGDCAKLAAKAARFASSLRAAVAEGNNTEIDLDCDESLFREDESQ